MSPLTMFDATRICSRTSAESEAWARPIPVRERAAVRPVEFSWRSMARNPNALVLSAAVGALLVRDALVRAYAPGAYSSSAEKQS